MADTTWTTSGEEALFPAKNNRLKFVIGGVLLVAAIAYFAGSETYVKPHTFADGSASGRFLLWAPGYYARVGA